MENEEPQGRGRPRIGRTMSIALPDDILEFIESERRLSEKLVGAAPTEATMIRTILERGRRAIESERKEGENVRT